MFIGTAVSQYGSLDALIVAFIQARMVWEIGHVFQQRPSLRHMGYLYANVLAASVIASRLDQVDLSEYVRPVLTGVVGQSIAGVPGVAAVSGQLSNAVFHGSVNAFLTLRVAMVAIAYSRATTRPERVSVWRTAVARASGLVVRTITTGSVEVSKAFAVAAAKSVTSAATGVGRSVVAGATAVGHGAVGAGRAVGAGATTAGAAVGRTARAAVDGATEFGNSTTKAMRDAAGKVGRRPKAPAQVDAAVLEGTDEE